MYAEYHAPYAPETCVNENHVYGCPCRAGGDREYTTTDPLCARRPSQLVSLRMNGMRCTTCGHRLDSLGDCDSCTADEAERIREAREWEDDRG